ncbi:hypothetical protein [Streptomyces nitrosporeus]|uniref:hypothetical protein n=1 Tax=Streptomyces nitrosporeus TaxID=28894 RepID=UPI0033305D6E
MTTRSAAAPLPGTRARVQAVRHRYARRGGRSPVRSHTYTLYLVSLFGVFYLVPIVHAASTSPALVPVGSPPAATAVGCALTVVVCWGAQLAGGFWGPLVLQPFLLHVYMSTDMAPTSYLGAVTRRRLACAGTAVLVPVCAAVYLVTDLFDHLETALPGLAAAVGLGALAAVAWLWGQVRAVADNLVLAAGAGIAALTVAAVSRADPDGGGGLWLLAGVLAAAAGVLGRVAFRSIRTVGLPRLARESARAFEALAYAWTGTLHHALDLYRPEPRGLTSALFRPDGRLRGHLAQGAARALRTRGRAAGAVVSLPAGGALAVLGATGPEGGPALLACLTGAVCVYLGSGWVGETWRGLRDELTLAPLLGEWWGGVFARTLAWPAVAVTAGTALGGGLVLLARWPLAAEQPVEAFLLVTGLVALVLGARFLREMKTQLPLGLLLPIVTPFGDLSGLLLVAWQFDGIVTVVTGAAVMDSLPSAPGAAALALGTAGCCVVMGLRRVGWAHRGLFSRLRRA